MGEIFVGQERLTITFLVILRLVRAKESCWLGALQPPRVDVSRLAYSLPSPRGRVEFLNERLVSLEIRVGADNVWVT